MTIGLLLAAAIVAVGDWAAVGRRYFRIEYLLKPLTLVLLIAAAAAADLGAAKVWVLPALAFSLAGDVALVCSDRAAAEPDSALLIGLGSFLLGHVCYLIAFARHGVHGLYLLAGLLVVAGAAALSLPQVLAGARGGAADRRSTARDHRGRLRGTTRRDGRVRRRDGHDRDRARRAAVPRVGHGARPRPVRPSSAARPASRDRQLPRSATAHRHRAAALIPPPRSGRGCQ
jgi:hypothetical protein